MAGQVAHVPGRGRAAARQLRGDVHDGHEVQLHPAEGLRLVKAEEPGLVQGLLVLANQHPRVFGLLGALAQDRHDLPRPTHRLRVADAGEVPTHCLRQRACGVALLAWVSHDRHSSTVAEAVSTILPRFMARVHVVALRHRAGSVPEYRHQKLRKGLTQLRYSGWHRAGAQGCAWGSSRTSRKTARAGGRHAAQLARPPVGPDQADALRRQRLPHPVAALRHPLQYAGLPQRSGRGLPRAQGAGRRRRHSHHDL